jgi:hypothetical protein
VLLARQAGSTSGAATEQNRSRVGDNRHSCEVRSEGVDAPCAGRTTSERQRAAEAATAASVTTLHAAVCSSRLEGVNESDTKREHKYTAIELCAGAGGMALAARNKGFEHVLLVENNGRRNHAAAI